MTYEIMHKQVVCKPRMGLDLGGYFQNNFLLTRSLIEQIEIHVTFTTYTNTREMKILHFLGKDHPCV